MFAEEKYQNALGAVQRFLAGYPRQLSELMRAFSVPAGNLESLVAVVSATVATAKEHHSRGHIDRALIYAVGANKQAKILYEHTKELYGSLPWFVRFIDSAGVTSIVQNIGSVIEAGAESVSSVVRAVTKQGKNWLKIGLGASAILAVGWLVASRKV